MALYKVKHGDTVRLVKATSAAAALRHVTTPMFEVVSLTDPSEAAEIAAGGVKVETAGEEVTSEPALDELEPKVLAAARTLHEPTTGEICGTLGLDATTSNLRRIDAILYSGGWRRISRRRLTEDGVSKVWIEHGSDEPIAA